MQVRACILPRMSHTAHTARSPRRPRSWRVFLVALVAVVALAVIVDHVAGGGSNPGGQATLIKWTPWRSGYLFGSMTSPVYCTENSCHNDAEVQAMFSVGDSCAQAGASGSAVNVILASAPQGPADHMTVPSGGKALQQWIAGCVSGYTAR
jgi:hypothetical protein